VISQLERLNSNQTKIAPRSVRTQGKLTQHGKPRRVIRDDQPDARERQAGRAGVAERPVVPLNRVMPVEGRGLGSRQTQQAVRDREIGQPDNSETCSEAADGVARESVRSCPRAGCGKSACPVRKGRQQTCPAYRRRATSLLYQLPPYSHSSVSTSLSSMCRPTRHPFRGRLTRLGEMSEDDAHLLHRGGGGSMSLAAQRRLCWRPAQPPLIQIAPG
jgi:hypothetical protein